MRTFSGYSKTTLENTYILLAGGGEKALSGLVNTDTAQSISGVKTFSSELKLGTRVTSTAPSSETEVTRLTLVPYYHTGGPWYIKSADDASNAFLKLYYGDTQLLKIKHDGTFMTTLKADITGSAGSVAWGNVTNKPAATGDTTTPVYWNGSSFTNCTSYADASVNYANKAGYINATRNFFAYAGGASYVGWVSIAKLKLQSNNYFDLHAFTLSIARSYNSPASESYLCAVTFGWCDANITLLNKTPSN
jgi:hypothetical protein